MAPHRTYRIQFRPEPDSSDWWTTWSGTDREWALPYVERENLRYGFRKCRVVAGYDEAAS